jgi:hypothetical protein
LATASTRTAFASKTSPGWPSISTLAFRSLARPKASPSSTYTRASSTARSGISASGWLGHTVSPTATWLPCHVSGKTRIPSWGAVTLSAERLFSACTMRSSAFFFSISASAMSAAASRVVGSRLASLVSTRFASSVRSVWLSRIWLREKICVSTTATSSARFSSSFATPPSTRSESPEWRPSRLALRSLNCAESRSERESANCFSTSVGSKITTGSPFFTGPAFASHAIRIGRCRSGGTVIGVDFTACSWP